MRAIVVVVASLFAAGCASTGTPADNTARAELRNAGGMVVATATLTQLTGSVRVVLEAEKLPAGVKGVHIHAVGIHVRQPHVRVPAVRLDPTELPRTQHDHGLRLGLDPQRREALAEIRPPLRHVVGVDVDDTFLSPIFAPQDVAHWSRSQPLPGCR